MDRSPRRYIDSRDSDSYRGAPRGERRRSPSLSRANTAAFKDNSNRELFRDREIPPRDSRDPRDLNRDIRDPPRGPRAGSKAYPDAPSGPRGSFSDGYRGDFGYRGDYRGRGRGRGRGWSREDTRRDESRDRDLRERDYRDRDRDIRRDERPTFRDRSRDRDWRGGRDTFRGRRPSSPPGRGRSPTYSNRDTRDAPSSLDLDRARRESRDGPLSANSPSSESSSQPFVHGYGRARGGGVGRGRGRAYYEDYHRPQGRSRSPEPSWSRRTQPSASKLLNSAMYLCAVSI
jgi:hypothetical protein